MNIQLSQPLSLRTHHGSVIVRYIERRSDSKFERHDTSGAGVVVTASESPTTPTFVRVQSSCVFGEAFHSTECDCAAQLSMAMENLIKENGLLVYCFEEGRGAGLRNKVSAMLVQKQHGITTDEAFQKLGLKADLRDYELACLAIKSILGPVPQIRLMTNNPDKINKLTQKGIVVVSVENALPPKIDRDALAELITKRNRFGHMIPGSIVDK